MASNADPAKSRAGVSQPPKRLSFVLYADNGAPSQRIYNATTGELLKTIPPELAAESGQAAMSKIDTKV